MEGFWCVVAFIVIVPLIYFGAPYIACFLTFIPIQIIGFFSKVVDFFKDDPTPPKSTYNSSKKNDSINSTSQTRSQPLSPSEFSDTLNSLRRTFPMVSRQDTSKLQALLKKYPEFADGQFCEFDFIDGKLRNVFKKDLPIEIKLELKRILPKNVYDEMNSRSNKQ